MTLPEAVVIVEALIDYSKAKDDLDERAIVDDTDRTALRIILQFVEMTNAIAAARIPNSPIGDRDPEERPGTS